MQATQRLLTRLALVALVLPTLVLPVASWHHHPAPRGCSDHACKVPSEPAAPAPAERDDGRCPVCALALLIVPEISAPLAVSPAADTLDLHSYSKHVAPSAPLPAAQARGPPNHDS